MNDVQQNKMNTVQQDETTQQAQQQAQQFVPQPVPQPNPTMNPYSNGTGSARPNISETDANNLNQFNQGMNMGASLFGIKKAKADVMKTQAVKDKLKA